MFRNYQELFSGYADFYTNHFLSSYQNVQEVAETILSNSSGSHEEKALCPMKSLANNAEQYQQLASKEAGLNSITNSVLVSESIQTTVNSRLSSGLSSGSFQDLTFTDIVYIITLTSYLIIAKRYLSSRLRCSTFLEKLGLKTKDRERLDECIWRLIYYSFSSSWLIYSCFLKRNAQLYLSLNQEVAEYSFSMDLDEHLICIIEVSFYLHATYALFFEDIWRRDSYMMLLHHIAAIFSLAAFYTTKTHKIGLTAVALRDTCDVLLEVTKLAMCLRTQNGKAVKSVERVVQVCMLIFTVAFVVNQLYYYPLFCLYHALNLRSIYNLRSLVVDGLLTCCLLFLLLDMVWFLLIVRLLYRMVFSSDKFRDLREYDEDDLDDDSNKVDEKANKPSPIMESTSKKSN